MSGDHHEHYEHYDAAVVERLDRGWGHVDRWINREIAKQIAPGTRVIDIGCGFGSLCAYLGERGVQAVGIDMLDFLLQAARDRYPRIPLVCADATRLPFGPGSLDTVVLKDSLHHLYDEAPLDEIFAELERVGVRQVVVSDPNPNPLLLLGRRLIGHVDPVCSPSAARTLLARYGFEVTELRYGVITSLPLSGGYVAPELIPGSSLVWTPLVLGDRVLSRLANLLRLGRVLGWRYFLTARRIAGSLG